jgi:hypothetical protein
MLTDLLIAGMMIAVAPDLPILGVARPAAQEQRTEAVTGASLCQGNERTGSRIALLEAHASFAALPPFSLARLGAGAAGSAPLVSKAKDAARCKS